jgi:hypothetical protein
MALIQGYVLVNSEGRVLWSSFSSTEAQAWKTFSSHGANKEFLIGIGYRVVKLREVKK